MKTYGTRQIDENNTKASQVFQKIPNIVYRLVFESLSRRIICKGNVSLHMYMHGNIVASLVICEYAILKILPVNVCISETRLHTSGYEISRLNNKYHERFIILLGCGTLVRTNKLVVINICWLQLAFVPNIKCLYMIKPVLFSEPSKISTLYYECVMSSTDIIIV